MATLVDTATSDISKLSIVSVATAAQEQQFCRLEPTLAPSQLNKWQADQHLLACLDGHAVARCSLWWRSAPFVQGETVGCIGHYAATDRTGARMLLAAASTQLASAGCTLAVGPLDGSTFRAYRFVTRRSYQGEPLPRFVFEPDNPDAWPADFIGAGFGPYAEYISALAPLTGPDLQLEHLTARLEAQGIRLRGLDPAIFDRSTAGQNAFDQEMARMYPLVMTAFAANPLFTPVSYEEFAAQYAPVRLLLAPRLVMLAERAGELVGFLLALPDFAQAQRGEAIDTVVLKTLAVLPGLAGMGLGSLLTAAVHTHAYDLGYRRAIHALMHVENRSRRISAHTALPFRGYTLFGHALTPAAN
jgi:GNAT superfamily N-acetyltransferase